VSVLTSRDNPKVKRWAKLVEDARYRRSERRAVIEGPHLIEAALQHGYKPVAVIATEKAAEHASLGELKPFLVSEAVFRRIADAESPQGIAAEIEIPQVPKRAASRVVFLEGVQDPSNVGAIIRSAAAFGIERVVVDRACADPWSPKCLRAGMGGHFALSIAQVDVLGDVLDSFAGKLACAVPRGGTRLEDVDAKSWVFGSEGAGVSAQVLERVGVRVTIPMAKGVESLNVAAAAAICLYESYGKGGKGA
jgi:TrmH family RNA methyltransferase